MKRNSSQLSSCLVLALGLGGSLTMPAQTFTESDVGTPAHQGSVIVANGVITENGGGNDIWNNRDNFHYYWTTVTGDFDCLVRVQNFTGPDTWSKAELMVRESFADRSGNLVPQGGDRFFANMATRITGQNGVGAQWRDTQNGWATWRGWPNPRIQPNYPNCWLRLQRVGDVFFASYSPDGMSWNRYASTDASRTQPFNRTVLVGLAVTAHNDGDLSGATAVFSDFQFLNPPPLASIPTRVAVSAFPLWTPTGVAVKANDTLVVTASGVWNYWNGTRPFFGPEGDPNSPPAALYDLFFSGALHGSLIAFIGSDPYQCHWLDRTFFPQTAGYWSIGDCNQITSDRAGMLWLGINDDAVSGAVGDNVGTVTAQICPPIVLTCPANVEVIAGLCASSAVVSYPLPTITDECGTPTVSYSQASGTSFAVGTTTVTWTAIDGCQQASCSFQVKVLTPQQATQLIIATVASLVNQGTLNDGQGNALVAKLRAAIASMDRCNANPACGQLGAFVNQVAAFLNARVLAAAQAQSLINAADHVMSAIGCQ